KTLVAALCAAEERPWATWNKGKPISDRQVARLLKPFAIISETVQTSETGVAKAKGYRRAHFEDAFGRYLTLANGASSQVGSAQACKRANADETGTTSDFFIRAETEMHGCEKCEKPANDGHMHVCTDKNPVDGNEATNGGSYPQVCVHCGDPATDDS